MSPLTILGQTESGDIAFQLGDHDEVLHLDESQLTALLNALTRDYLSLWPERPCEGCDEGRNAVVTIEGRHKCEGCAMSYGMAEDESFEALR